MREAITTAISHSHEFTRCLLLRCYALGALFAVIFTYVRVKSEAAKALFASDRSMVSQCDRFRNSVAPLVISTVSQRSLWLSEGLSNRKICELPPYG